MFVHAVLLVEPNSEVASRIDSRYPSRYRMNDTCYLVRSDGLSEDVAIAVGIKGSDRVEDAGGVVLKLNGAYAGFASRSLWEWLSLEDRNG